MSLPYPINDFLARLRLAAGAHLSDKPLLIVAAADEISSLREKVECLEDDVKLRDRELERVKIALAGAISERDKLREALRPFAFYAEQRARQPFRGMDDAIHTIHVGTEYEAEIRLSHCVAAQKALGQ